MKIKIIEEQYDRNGVSGIGFKKVRFNCFEGEAEDFYCETLVATINYNEDGKTFDPISCRVINPLNFLSSYRGDTIGYELAKQLINN